MDEETKRALEWSKDELIERAKRGRAADVAREDPRHGDVQATYFVVELTNRSGDQQVDISRPDSTSRTESRSVTTEAELQSA